MKKNTVISRVEGNIHVDDRGIIHFINDFDFKNVKRFYQVENFNNSIIRAFHGHRKEGKYVYVAAGSILLCCVYIDDFSRPSRNAHIEREILSDKKSDILYIPPHFANGFKSLEDHTKVIFYSTSTLNFSTEDDYRFPFDYWGTEIWNVGNR